MHEDRLYDVWRTRPGAMTQVAALSSPDLALREFAESLDPAWTIVDLRQREVGMGVAWGPTARAPGWPGTAGSGSSPTRRSRSRAAPGAGSAAGPASRASRQVTTVRTAYCGSSCSPAATTAASSDTATTTSTCRT